MQQTSGTLSSVEATKLLSLRPAYLCRCEENSLSIPCAGCTDTITSLDKYAILATNQKQFISECSNQRRGRETPQLQGTIQTYQPLQVYGSSTKKTPYCCEIDCPSDLSEGEKKLKQSLAQKS